MNPYRFFNRVKLQDANWDSFVSQVAPFVQIGEETEPDMLQYEAFANAEKKEVIWLEGFRGIDGFDKHLVNPAHSEVQQKLLANKPEPRGMYFSFPPSEATLRGLKSMGFEVEVLEPWDATNKLKEEKRSTDWLQLMSIVEVNDMSGCKDFFSRMEAAISQQSGVLYHQSFQLNATQVFAMGEYASISSFQAWLQKFQEGFVEEFQSYVVSQQTMALADNTTAELKALADAWNAPIYEKIAGFVRY